MATIKIGTSQYVNPVITTLKLHSGAEKQVIECEQYRNEFINRQLPN